MRLEGERTRVYRERVSLTVDNLYQASEKLELLSDKPHLMMQIMLEQSRLIVSQVSRPSS